MSELIYEKKVLIRSEQVNMNRVLRTSELFKLLEEASIAHTEELGCTRERTLDRGLLWVITRQRVEISELPGYDDEVTVRSWPGDMMHVLFPRFYEICKGGRPIIQGQALWTLIDETSRSVADPDDYQIEIPGLPGAPDAAIHGVRLPESGFSFDRSEEVRFSQVDINGHVNNTRYFDIIEDALGAPYLAEHTPSEISASYLCELRAGESYRLRGMRVPPCSGSLPDGSPDADSHGAEESETWYFEGLTSKPNFRIKVNYI